MNLLKYATTARKVKNDPFGFLIDTLTKVIVNLVVPIPLAGEIAALFKGPILGFLGSLLILVLFMLIAVGTVFMSPLLLGSAFLQQITSSIFPQNALHIAPDTSFIETAIPRQNPFGGSGMSYTSVTAYFLDPDYYLKFGKNHTGIDLVPSDAYYKNSKTYQEVHKVAIFATINGSVNHYVDQYGGETVEITNTDNSLKVVYIHFSAVLVDTGVTVKAGTPIGIMGGSGFTTGPHVHYEIRTKDGDTWHAVNPLGYIQ